MRLVLLLLELLYLFICLYIIEGIFSTKAQVMLKRFSTLFRFPETRTIKGFFSMHHHKPQVMLKRFSKYSQNRLFYKAFTQKITCGRQIGLAARLTFNL